ALTRGHGGPVASVGENSAGNCGCARTGDRYAAAARPVRIRTRARRSAGVDGAADGDLAAVGREIDEAASVARGPGCCGDETGDNIADGRDLHAAGAQGSIGADVADGDAVTKKIDAPAVGRDVAVAERRGDA